MSFHIGVKPLAYLILRMHCDNQVMCKYILNELDNLIGIYLPPTILTLKFTFFRSVGIIGRRHSHAIWFYGVSCSCNGTNLYGSNPSYCTINARLDDTLRVSEIYTSSFYAIDPATITTNKFDQSIALAFT